NRQLGAGGDRERYVFVNVRPRLGSDRRDREGDEPHPRRGALRRRFGGALQVQPEADGVRGPVRDPEQVHVQHRQRVALPRYTAGARAVRGPFSAREPAAPRPLDLHLHRQFQKGARRRPGVPRRHQFGEGGQRKGGGNGPAGTNVPGEDKRLQWEVSEGVGQKLLEVIIETRRRRRRPARGRANTSGLSRRHKIGGELCPPMSGRRYRLAVFVLILALVAAYPAVASAAELVIMATTDIHANIYPWDYYANRPNDNVGLAKIYTLVKEIRASHPNTLLFDNGDLIQGTPLASYLVANGLPAPGEVHPIIDVMNRMGYDAAAPVKHEFNFGLGHPKNTIAGAKFPFLAANVYHPGTQDPYFTPYVILERTIDGQPIRIGVIGFVPPQIMVWDRTNLTGKVEAGSIIEAAQRFVPEMKAKGADIGIALAHTGATPGNRAENAAYTLAEEVPGIAV